MAKVSAIDCGYSCKQLWHLNLNMNPYWRLVLVFVLILSGYCTADNIPKDNTSTTQKKTYVQMQKSRYAKAAFSLNMIERSRGMNQALINSRTKSALRTKFSAEAALRKIGYDFDTYAVAMAEHFTSTSDTTLSESMDRFLFERPIESSFPLYNFMQDWDASSRPEFNNVYLLGERNSGTKFAASIVGRVVVNISAHSSDAQRSSNDQPKTRVVSRAVPSENDIPVLGYKHMFRGTLLNESEMQMVRETSNKGALWLLVVRNPCDWVDGMYRIPWHICNPLDKMSGGCDPYPNGVGENIEAVYDMTRLEFLKSTWVDWAQWFVERMHNPEEYRTPTPDWSTATYSDIFELRTFKLRLMLQIMEAVPRNFKVVHLDYLELSTDHFLHSIKVEFNISRKGIKAARAHPHQRVTCLTDEEWQITQARLDWDVESKFGFLPFDCHKCINPEPPS